MKPIKDKSNIGTVVQINRFHKIEEAFESFDKDSYYAIFMFLNDAPINLDNETDKRFDEYCYNSISDLHENFDKSEKAMIADFVKSIAFYLIENNIDYRLYEVTSVSDKYIYLRKDNDFY